MKSSASLTHAEAVDQVLIAARVIAEHNSDDDDKLVQRLIGVGFTPLQGEKLVSFVPTGFAWPFLRRLGIESFPSNFTVMNDRDEEVRHPVSKEHYFTASLWISQQILDHGYTKEIPKEVYIAITQRSADMHAVNNALAAKDTVKGAKISLNFLPRLTAEQLATDDGDAPADAPAKP